MLLSLCTEFNLVLTNTSFNNTNKWIYSWSHPCSKYWHLLDYVLTRRRDITDLCNTRAMCGADCDTDHLMIRTKLKVVLKPPCRKTAAKLSKQLDVSALDNPDTARELASKLDAVLDAAPPKEASSSDLWMDLKAKVYQTATEVLGHPKRRHADWFDENDPTIKLLLENRKKLYTKTLEARCACSTEIQHIRSKAELQKSLREVKDKWLLQKAIEIQCLGDAKDSNNLFAALKEVCGPTTGTLVPVAVQMVVRYTQRNMKSCAAGLNTSGASLTVLPL